MARFLDVAEQPAPLMNASHGGANAMAAIIVDESIDGSSSQANTGSGSDGRPSTAETASSAVASHMMSISRSNSTSSSYAFGVTKLPPLQTRVAGDVDGLEPLAEEDVEPGDFDLVAPKALPSTAKYSLESRSETLFSKEHMATIFSDPSLAAAFNRFLYMHRPSAVPLLNYYFDALKALKAIAYSNAIQQALEPLVARRFTHTAGQVTTNPMLQEKADRAFEALAQEELPRFITYTWCQTVKDSVQNRITGKMPSHLLSMSEGLAEVFCLSDPSRDDNPIIFASEEFHRTTQYGHDFVIGRNCRFLQGPKTNPFAVKRISDECRAGRPHCEVLLNYRRDGSPFMNLLMTAPLVDSMGNIRYFLGAQVDVSGLVKGNVGLPSLERLVGGKPSPREGSNGGAATRADEFRDFCEMFNEAEIETVRNQGGKMHRQCADDRSDDRDLATANWNRSRIVIQDDMPPAGFDHGSNLRVNSYADAMHAPFSPVANNSLHGFYEHYLVVRRPPSLRILFVSPSLRMPGMLQSPFLSRIGGSSRVRDELTQALSYSTSITAKVRWISRGDPDGRPRWIHCTPLLGVNREVGAWIVVLVDDNDQPRARRKMAPPIEEIERNSTVDFADAFEDGSFDVSALRPGTGYQSHCRVPSDSRVYRQPTIFEDAPF